MEAVRIEELVEKRRVAEIRNVREEMEILTRTCNNLVEQLTGIMKKINAIEGKMKVS